jgi:aryl-alcohol dehydrogenase-like predicted oxidoreductase
MTARTYYCPTSEGAGCFTYSPSGSGFLELDATTDDTDGLRPYTPSKRRWARPYFTSRNTEPLERIGKLRGLVRQHGRKSGSADDYALELAWLRGREGRHERAAAILAKLRTH